MIDFPASPTTNQIFTVSGTSWRYNGASWAAYTGSLVGDITSVVAGTGLTGGGTSGDVILNLANTAVAAGSYTYATLTVDAQGRLTAASNGTTPGTVTSITAGTGLTGGAITTSGTIALSVPVSVANGGTGATTTAGAPWLPLAGGQLNPGGLLVGAAGSVPGPGSLTLNANTVAPAAPMSSNVYVIGADGTNPNVGVDCFGSGVPIVQTRHARGTAASATAIQSADWLGVFDFVGRDTAAYSSGVRLTASAFENWTSTAHGTALTLATVPAGSTAEVNSLVLTGNSATIQNQLTVGTLPTGWYPQNTPGDFGAGCMAAGGGAQNGYIASTNWGSLEITASNNGAYLDLNRVGGTYAAPTALGNNQQLGAVSYTGTYNTTIGTNYTGAQIVASTNENWSATNRGSNIVLATTPNGTNSRVNSLTLAGNTATFSGQIIAQQAAGQGIGINIITSAADATIYLSGSPRTWVIGNQLTSGGFYIFDNTGGQTRLTIDTTGACKNTTGTWSTISDTRAKTNIEPYDAGLQAVLALKPIRYDLATDDWQGEGLVGFRAEEVAKVLPELCGTATAKLKGEDAELQTVAPTGVVFALVNAIKELKAEIDSLKAQLAGA